MFRFRSVAVSVFAAALVAVACGDSKPAPQPAQQIAPSAAPVVVAPLRPQVSAVPAPAPKPAELVLGLEHGRCLRDAAAHLDEGRLAAKAGDARAAVAAFRAALHHDPSSSDAAAAIAHHGSTAGDRALARQAAALWAALVPGDATPLLRGARLALDAKDDREALALAEKALDRDPLSAEAYHVKGRIFFRAEQFGAAIAAFESAVELDTGHAFAFNGIGLSHLRLGNWRQAMEALTAATLLRPDVAYIHTNLGLAYEKLGYTSEALAEYRMAVTIDPNYVKAHVNHQRLSALADARWFVLERQGPPAE